MRTVESGTSVRLGGQYRFERQKSLIRVVAGEGPLDLVARGGVEPPTFRFSDLRRAVVECREVPEGVAGVRGVSSGAG
jgi:hypothetical protein